MSVKQINSLSIGRAGGVLSRMCPVIPEMVKQSLDDEFIRNERTKNITTITGKCQFEMILENIYGLEIYTFHNDF